MACFERIKLNSSDNIWVDLRCLQRKEKKNTTRAKSVFAFHAFSPSALFSGMMKSEQDEEIQQAQVVAEATAMPAEVNAEELEEFRQFQAFQRAKQQLQKQPQQQQQQPAVYPSQPMHVAHPVGVAHSAQAIMPGDAPPAPWMTTCYPCSSCCSRKCSLMTCVVIEGLFMVVSIASIGLGWVPYNNVSFFSIIPSMLVLPAHFFATGMAGSNAGCYAYCCNRHRGKGCFHDRQAAARKAYSLMIASLVLGFVAFVMSASTAVCFNAGMWVFCGVGATLVLISSVLGFVSTICFAKEVSKYTIACGPIVVQHAAANIQMTQFGQATIIRVQ